MKPPVHARGYRRETRGTAMPHAVRMHGWWRLTVFVSRTAVHFSRKNNAPYEFFMSRWHRHD